MYPLISVLIIIVGVILFVLANKIAKNKTPIICIRAVSIILIAAGALLLYFLLSGRLVLPLSNN